MSHDTSLGLVFPKIRLKIRTETVVPPLPPTIPHLPPSLPHLPPSLPHLPPSHLPPLEPIPPSLPPPHPHPPQSPHSAKVPSPFLKPPSFAPSPAVSKIPRKSSKASAPSTPSVDKMGLKTPSIPQRKDTPLPQPKSICLLTSTPNGNIPPVPTSSQTPNRINRVSINKEEFNPILTATIYLNLDKEKEYSFVSDKMRSINATVSSIHSEFKTRDELPLLLMTGKVPREAFEEALEIYENNQVFYQIEIEKGNSVSEKLTELENWFCMIIEPPESDEAEDKESCEERELFKIEKGYSAYCDPELYKFIKPVVLPPARRKRFIIR